MYFYKETIAAYHQATPKVIAGTAGEKQGITATKHFIPYLEGTDVNRTLPS